MSQKGHKAQDCPKNNERLTEQVNLTRDLEMVLLGSDQSMTN